MTEIQSYLELVNINWLHSRPMKKIISILLVPSWPPTTFTSGASASRSQIFPLIRDLLALARGRDATQRSINRWAVDRRSAADYMHSNYDFWDQFFFQKKTLGYFLGNKPLTPTHAPFRHETKHQNFSKKLLTNWAIFWAIHLNKLKRPNFAKFYKKYGPKSHKLSAFNERSTAVWTLDISQFPNRPKQKLW